MSRWKVPATLVCTFLAAMALAGQSQLSPRFQTVFILSMANSLDQHLASRLTSNRILWVVLQPANADAVLTDSLDEDFWAWLDRNYAVPATPAAAAGDPAGAAAGDREPANRAGYLPASKHRGTIFLVDPRKRVVLWSTYELPRDSSPASLDRSASRICTQLRTAFGKK